MLYTHNHDAKDTILNMIKHQDESAEPIQDAIDLNPYAAPPIPDERNTEIDTAPLLTEKGEIDIAATTAQMQKIYNRRMVMGLVSTVLIATGMFLFPLVFAPLISSIDFSSDPFGSKFLFPLIFGVIFAMVVYLRISFWEQAAVTELARMLGLPEKTNTVRVLKEANFIIKEAKRLEQERLR